MKLKDHWEKVYSTKAADEVSWFQVRAERSLKVIHDAHISLTASIIDVGGGASTFVDDLLASGYQNLTVLDLSGAALAVAKNRLSSRAAQVNWLEANVIETEFTPQTYDVWHDRAVFHFLTSAEERHTYVQAVKRAVKSGGLIIVATFADDGPTKCSGLPIVRYSANALTAEFDDAFALIGHDTETHTTPSGNTQKFIYCFFRKL
jgi:2-polyprenyl-3-methyl-5-hydroxy-6-metoxy-1,4-benzoquinol methylase